MRSINCAATSTFGASTRTDTIKLPGCTRSCTLVMGTFSVDASCARYEFASNESIETLMRNVVCTVLVGTRKAYGVGGDHGGEGARGDGWLGGEGA